MSDPQKLRASLHLPKARWHGLGQALVAATPFPSSRELQR
jgi:hypothetical protein